MEILKKEGIDDPVLFDAICAHNPESGVKAKTKLQYAILASDPMSGFLKAIAQIYPDVYKRQDLCSAFESKGKAL